MNVTSLKDGTPIGVYTTDMPFAGVVVCCGLLGFSLALIAASVIAHLEPSQVGIPAGVIGGLAAVAGGCVNLRMQNAPLSEYQLDQLCGLQRLAKAHGVELPPLANVAILRRRDYYAWLPLADQRMSEQFRMSLISRLNAGAC